VGQLVHRAAATLSVGQAGTGGAPGATIGT
jgi:hypothetical protein